MEIQDKQPLTEEDKACLLYTSIGSHNDNANAAKMEKLLEDGINAIGLGPQGMGGKYSVMGVNIENTARHPSTIGVAAVSYTHLGNSYDYLL